ncbi:TonB-dependent receptor domain-containing protein [Parapedobacter sp. DT-150]|uniref:TonB-dependent receptor domain-containing protein n=1 Tax=Parapedobacter sp. DT-150 TaxID=3396162 RepID=UPI003F1AD537
MIKRSLVLLLLAIISIGQNALAQSRVSGAVVDSATRWQLPFVTVRLVDKDQKHLQNSVSDSLGRFYFEEVPPGIYRIHCRMTGYVPKVSEHFTVKDSIIELPPCLMARSGQTLAEVTVTAQGSPISTRIDGFVYHADQEIQEAGETAADLLRKLPGVQVDPNGTPHMRGSNRIKVFIDGKPSMTYATSVTEALRQIPADNIKTVEIITHPSARYDAEGADGVINIFTKTPVEDGVSGTVNGTLANRFNELTGAITWRKRQLVLGLDIGHSASDNVTTSVLERTDHSVDGDGLRQQKEINNESENLFGGINVIYLPDTLTTLNAGYRYSGDRFGAKSTLNNLMESDAFTRTIDNPAFRYLHGINWGWLRRSRDGSAEYNIMGYWFYQGQRNRYLLDQYRQQQKNYSEKNLNLLGNREFSFQADGRKDFGNDSELELGLKGAFRRFFNENLFDVFDFNRSVYLPDSLRADRFWFNWMIAAAYATYTLNLDSWKIKIGGRYEYTHWPLHFRDTSLNIPDYQNFLPNLIISKTISTDHNMGAGYTRKLLRPYINYLNPVVNYIDSLNLEYGNPNLKPAITNSYELTYTFRKSAWLLNVALFYNQTGNSIEPVRVAQPDGIVANTYANVADHDVLGVSIDASLRLKRFTFILTNTTRHLEFGSQNGYLFRNGFIINQGVDASFKPNASLTIRAYANLNSRTVNFQGYATGVQSYTLSVSKELLDGKLNLSARCDNLFTPYRYVTEVTAAETFDQHVESRYINRFFRVALRWKLGKKEVERPEIREIDGY